MATKFWLVLGAILGGQILHAVEPWDLSAREKEAALSAQHRKLVADWRGWTFVATEDSPFIISVPIKVGESVQLEKVCIADIEAKRGELWTRENVACKPTANLECPRARECFLEREYYSYVPTQRNQSRQGGEPKSWELYEQYSEQNGNKVDIKGPLKEEHESFLKDYENWEIAYSSSRLTREKGIFDPRIYEITRYDDKIGLYGTTRICSGIVSLKSPTGETYTSPAVCVANSEGVCPEAAECVLGNDFSSYSSDVVRTKGAATHASQPRGENAHIVQRDER